MEPNFKFTSPESATAAAERCGSEADESRSNFIFHLYSNVERLTYITSRNMFHSTGSSHPLEPSVDSGINFQSTYFGVFNSLQEIQKFIRGSLN